MERGALPEELAGVDMNNLTNTVLPWRTEKYIEEFLEKMDDEGISTPSDLTRVSKELLEMKLSTHANFNYIELADALSLRKYWASMPAKDAHPKQNDHKGTHQTPRGGRSRSRSPRRRGGRGGQRNSNRPYSASKKNSQNGNRNQVKPELWAAVAQGDAVKVQELLKQGKDPAEKFENWSPLMKASEEGNEEVMRMLLDMKVDVEAANRKGRTALSFAAAPSHDGSTPRPTAVAAIRLLLQSGVDANKRDVTGATAKDWAAREKRDDALAVFDEFGL